MNVKKTVPRGITTVFYILGICTLLPWNFFITADPFWQYKLRNTTYNASDWRDSPLTELQVSFLPTFSILSNVLNLVFVVLTSFMTIGINDRLRIQTSLWICLISMTLITLLAFFNTDNWQHAFFGISMTLVSTLNVGIAVMQSSLYGLAGMFPSLCITSLFSGQAISGVVSSIAMLISLAIGKSDPVRSGITYFVIADAFILLSLLAFNYLLRSETYKEVKMGDIVSTADKNEDNKVTLKSYFSILRNIKGIAFTSAFCLCATLAIFPTVQVYISSTMEESAWTKTYFQPTVTFLIFNLFDWIGREATRIIQWPPAEGSSFHIFSASRIVLVPLIMLCYGSNKGFYTLFYNDFFYIAFNTLFAFSNGYILALCLIYYKRFVKPFEVELAGTVVGGTMAIGLTVGSAISPLMVAVWQPRNP